MQQQMMRNFTKSRNSSHPFLASGNFIEGTLGILAIGTGIYSIVLYGMGITLVLSLLYTVAVTVIALMSAYYLV